MYLPKNIKKLIGERKYKIDSIGMSSASVVCFGDMILKIGAAENEYKLLMWLHEAELPVPMVYAWETVDGVNYLLMSRIGGEMLCSERFMKNPKLLIKRMAQAYELLWSCKPEGCVRDVSLGSELDSLRILVESGQCTMPEGLPGILDVSVFDSPKTVYDWLCKNRPDERKVLSHGDFCLPNIFADDRGVCGFIDVGDCGVADPYRDIAMGYRSLYNNFEGCFSRPGLPKIDYNSLFYELGITPDREKLSYYLLLNGMYG